MTDTLREDVREDIYDRFTDGLYGTAEYNTTQIMAILEKWSLLDRDDETKIELIKLDGIDMIVITDPDGTSKHVQIAAWVEGQPRPTEPGVYQDPAHPATIYTLYSHGSWKHNRQISNIWLDSSRIPDNLIKIA